MAQTSNSIFLPLKDVRRQLKKDSSPENVLKVLNGLFPDLTEDVLKAITSLDVALNLTRQHTGISRSYVWSAPRQNSVEGFSRDQRTQWALGLLNMMDKLEEVWPIDSDRMQLIVHQGRFPTGVNFNWDQAADLSNFHLWTTANKGSNTFDVPALKETTTSRDFTLEVRPVVVNPDEPDQVWASGEALELPANFASMSEAKKKQAWNALLETNRDRLMEEFGFDKVPTAFHHPQLRLRWNVIAPDGETYAYQDRSVNANWLTNTSGQAWLNKITSAIEQAYVKAGQWFVLANLVRISELDDEETKNGLNTYLSDLEWDYMSFPRPHSNQEFFDVVAALKKNNPQKFDVVTTTVLQSVFEALKAGHGSLGFQKYESVLLLPQLREWFADLPWNQNQDKKLQEFIDAERNFVQSTIGGDLKELSQKVDEKDFKDLVEILLWNDVDLPTSLRDELFPQPNDVIPEEKVDSTKTLKKVFTSPTDWSDLLSAFDMPFTPTTSTTLVYGVTEDGTVLNQVGGDTVHPFARWMERLSPSSLVEEKTQLWLLDNENFNALNRVILKEKDGDEVALNAQLAEKLKNVMEITTKVMQENQQNGGWLGRLRFKQGNSTDSWADAFADFQNHMVMMYGRISKQVERDRLWLKHADSLIAQSNEVDAVWANWLSSTAQVLQDERTTKVNPSTEEKMLWNEKISVLQSANLAHDHIKTANAVTTILLEKVRQSVQVKERLQNRSMMFYWQSLSMFAGLQSLQRNANGILEQSEMVAEMEKSFNNMTSRSLAEEQKEKEQIREAMKKMASSTDSMEQFFRQMASYQKDVVTIMAQSNDVRVEMQKETMETVSLSSSEVKKRRQKRATVSAPSTSTGPRP